MLPAILADDIDRFFSTGLPCAKRSILMAILPCLVLAEASSCSRHPFEAKRGEVCEIHRMPELLLRTPDGKRTVSSQEIARELQVGAHLIADPGITIDNVSISICPANVLWEDDMRRSDTGRWVWASGFQVTITALATVATDMPTGTRGVYLYMPALPATALQLNTSPHWPTQEKAAASERLEIARITVGNPPATLTEPVGRRFLQTILLSMTLSILVLAALLFIAHLIRGKGIQEQKSSMVLSLDKSASRVTETSVPLPRDQPPEPGPKTFQEFVDRGAWNFREGHYLEAQADFSIAIAMEPKRAFVYYNRGIVCMKLGQLEGAVEDFAVAIDVSPRFVKAMLRRGDAFRALSRHGEALMDYHRVLAIDPHNAIAHLRLGITHK
jgi:hypothetical protein